ncbi:MAG: hypothetical protein VXY41_05640, partial [Pseudomonadota bacterium]|nr:hypothetical protein [Pseudomonadota bacterium]
GVDVRLIDFGCDFCEWAGCEHDPESRTPIVTMLRKRLAETPDREAVIAYMIDALGTAYDVKNVIDLARYLLPQPPVPVKWRRRMIALGSGEPSQAICSTLIARAFQSVGYPILPDVTVENQREVLHIRHHSLFTPRDFDVSPYFDIVKPLILKNPDYKSFNWNR